MQRRWLVMCVLLGVAATGRVDAPHRGDEATQGREAADHPGYFEQWRAMKAGNRKSVPLGLRTEWERDDRAKARVSRSDLVDKVAFIGPTAVGGRTRALLVDRRDTNRWFAGAISGGIWVTEDAGKHWRPIDDGAVCLMVSCLTQNPLNPNEIYYGTGEARSNTAGTPGEGVFNSIDGGKRFRQLPKTANDPRFANCWCIAHATNANDTVYVGTEAGLFRTDDGGGKWTSVLVNSLGDYPVTTLLVFPDGGVLAAVSGVGMMRSPDGTAGSFKPVTSAKFPPDFQRIEIAMCEAKPDVVYAAFESPQYLAGAIGCFVSPDRGLNWSEVAVPPTGPIYSRYCFVLGVHPADPDRVVCAGRGPNISTKGGKSWQALVDFHSDYHRVVSLPGGDDFLVGNDGGVFKYSWKNLAAAPVNLNSGYQVTQFYAGDVGPTGDLYIGGSQDNGTWRLTGKGETKVQYNDGGFCYISRQEPKVAYSASQNGDMYRTTNFLDPTPAWTYINTNAAMNAEKYRFLNPYAMNPVDAQQLYCGTQKAIWRSLNGGTQWSRLTAGTRANSYMIVGETAADPTVYVCGELRTFFRIDRAATATPGSEVDMSASVPETLGGSFLAAMTLHPKTSGTLFVGCSDFSPQPRLWRVDAANTASPTWKSIAGDLPAQLPVNALYADSRDPDRVLFAGTDFGLYISTNGGATWTKESRVPNVVIDGIRYQEAGKFLALFTHGRGGWKVTLK